MEWTDATVGFRPMNPDDPVPTSKGEAVDHSTWDDDSIPDFGIARLADIPASFFLGKTIDGRYEIRDQIGEGGFSLVFRARQLSTDCDVAIKFPRNAAEAAARVRKGQRLLGRLHHHYIARLIDAGQIEAEGLKLPYVVMELVPGAMRLTDHFRDGSMNRIGRLELFAKVCDAVAAAHRSGVVHRDLKPGNILVNAAGEPRVIDFDIAITVTRPRIASFTESFSADSRITGTVLYMSPEQWHGETVGPPSDVYSLGIVLRELLTGRESTYPEAIARLERPPVPERDQATGTETLPRCLGRIIAHCLRHDPAERWPDAGMLVAEVHACIRHLSSTSAFGRLLERCEAGWSGSWSRRAVVAAVAAALVAVATAAAAVVAINNRLEPYPLAVHRAADQFSHDRNEAARKPLVAAAEREWRQRSPTAAMPPELVCMKALLPDAVAAPLADGLVTRFDADGRWFATATATGGVILAETTQPSAARYRLSGFQGNVTSLAWGPGGLLVGGDANGTILLWNGDENRLEHDSSPRLRATMVSGGPVAVDVAVDGARVAAASASGEFCCWSIDPQDGTIQRLFCGPPGDDCPPGSPTPSIRFSADGSRLFVSMPDGRLRVLDGRTGKEQAIVGTVGRMPPTLCGPPDRSQLMSFTPDGPFLRHDAATGAMLPWPTEAPSGCLQATFMAGGERLVAVYDDPGDRGRGSRLVIFDTSAEAVLKRPVILHTDRRITDIAGLGNRLVVEIDGGRRLWSADSRP